MSKATTKTRYRIAVVGCGRISKNHFGAIETNKERLELVGVCDIVPERAEEASKANGEVPWFTDLDAMLDAVKADLLLIGTPSGLHAKQTVAGARHGVHVITEKPMAINLESADEMIRACDAAGVQLFVVKQNRLNATVQMLRRAVEKGRFGRIFFAQVNVFWTRPQSYYDQAPWRGTWELDGGAFMNQASHYVDMLQWLVGEVESVQAATATLDRRIEAEDTGAAVVRFRNGAIGSLNTTMLSYPKNREGSITILGETGTVKLGGAALNKIEAWEFAEYDDDDKTVEQTDYTLPAGPGSVYGFGHAIYLGNVVAALDGDEGALTDGRSGRKSLELILAIYKSARDRTTVSLPLRL